MRLLPRSLFSRLVLVLLAGLIVAQLVSLAIHMHERGELLSQASGRQSAQRIADIVGLLETLNPGERRRIVSVLSAPPMTISLDQPPLAAGGQDADTGARALLFETMLRRFLGDGRPVAVRVSEAPAMPVKPAIKGGMKGPGMHGDWTPPWAALHDASPSGLSFVAQVRLQDGALVTFDARPPAQTASWPYRLLVSIAVLLVAVIAVSLIAVRWTTRPLNALADAADELGRNIHRSPLEEKGPLEVARAARAFNTMQSRLAGYIRDRTRVLAAMSHDLKTPITRLRLRSELLEDPQARAKLTKDLDEMESMVGATLDFLRGQESGERTQPVDVMALLESLQADLAEMGGAVSIEGGAKTPYPGRPQALKRCLANLLENAVKYGRSARVLVADDAARLEIRIQDDGPGLPEAELKKVFEPFYRAEGSRSRDTGDRNHVRRNPAGANRWLRAASKAGGMLAASVALLVGACSSPRYDVPRPPSNALDRPEETFLGRALVAQLAASPGLSGFHLIVSGQEAFIARAALAESAQRTLDLQYYIVAEDATATLLLYRALSAAQRGVRVRLLIDDLYAAGRDFDLANFAAHPNVQVRVFNPFLKRGPLGISHLLEYLGDGTRLNRRMHNKLWIADNAAAVLGGRNLGDAYFNVGGESDFADLDVLAAGPAVAEISRSFDAYWNSEWAVPIAAFVGESPGSAQLELVLVQMAQAAERFRETEYARSLRATDLGRLVRDGQFPLVAAHARAIYEPPARLGTETSAEPAQIMSTLRSAIEAARREVILVSPWLIPSERGMGVLCTLAQRGVRVRVLTNSLASTDVPVVHAGYSRYRPRLAACGVELHELRADAGRLAGEHPVLSSGASLASATTLHAKAVAVDREIVLVGSMNLDPRSRTSNTEVAVLIESAALGGQLGALFDEAASPGRAFRVELAEPGNEHSRLAWVGQEEGKPVRYASEPLASWWRRFIGAVLGALAPEELL